MLLGGLSKYAGMSIEYFRKISIKSYIFLIGTWINKMQLSEKKSFFLKDIRFYKNSQLLVSE